jgi:hypothetical protein
MSQESKIERNKILISYEEYRGEKGFVLFIPDKVMYRNELKNYSFYYKPFKDDKGQDSLDFQKIENIDLDAMFLLMFATKNPYVKKT